MVNVFGANIGGEELEEVRSCLESSWMGIGKKVQKFETELSQRNSLPGLVMVDSGSNALQLAIQLLHHRGLQPKSKIIVPSFTWVACANSVLLAGHQIVFADVDIHTQNITKETIAKVISKDVGAIMIVHYAGKPVDMDGIRSFGLPIIEDAAHAIDSQIDGKYCGSFGDVAIYSFDSIKNLATPEGGGIIADEELLSLAREYRYCGVSKSGFSSAAANPKDKWWEHRIKHVWPKMLPNDVCASIGLAQLRKLDSNQTKRKSIWDRYQEAFSGLECLVRPVEATQNEKHSYFTYFVRITNGRRNELAKYLLDNGVYTSMRYHPLHLNDIYYSKRRLSICETLNDQGLNLPLHPAMKNEDVDVVIDLIRRWM
jgi:aminotransferase